MVTYHSLQAKESKTEMFQALFKYLRYVIARYFTLRQQQVTLLHWKLVLQSYSIVSFQIRMEELE